MILSFDDFDRVVQHSHNSNSNYLIVNQALFNLNNLYKHNIKSLKENINVMMNSLNDSYEIVNLEIHVYETVKLLKNIHQNIFRNWESFIHDVEKLCSNVHNIH